jgi:uroporphyrinogen decarboxylase
MKLQENALLALDTINQKSTKGIPSFAFHVMKHSYIERLAGVPEGTYKKKPVETYLRMQKNIGTCLIDQFIPTNPLSMEDYGYESGGTTATTGLKQIVMDGMVIDSPEAVVAHLEQKVFPQLRAETDKWVEQPVALAKEKSRQICIEEETTQLILGPDILKAPYGNVQNFPYLFYGNYGYENYFMAYALYPEVIERHFSLQADLAVHVNRAIARAYLEGELPPLLRLDHDMADSRGMLVDIKSLDKIWFPHFARSMKPLLDAGIKLLWHSDGNLMQMVPRLLEVGIKGFQGFQYECGMDYEKMCAMKTREGGDLIMLAGISATDSVLRKGSPADVKRYLKWIVDKGPKTGLFISSMGIYPDMPWENVQTYVEGMKHYRENGRS